ncbi:MAG: hypothetical protein OXT09_30150 [Myxococcales bacterium]|nr:hypothetical protein [Myxococcales bacterium]
MPSHALDHIAFGVHEMSACVPVLEGLLGGEPYEGGPSPGFDWAQWRFADGARLELWEAALGGSPATEGDGLRFRWPDSPLSIWTGFDADAAPGPRGLELARRPIGDWPEAPLEPLGTRLVPG